jgi:hypothetical protein
MPGIEDDVEVTINIRAEALKVTDFVKDGGGDHKHVFNAHGSFTLRKN